MNSEEKRYQKYFCDKYFGAANWEPEVLNRVDALLKGRRRAALLYIEFKYRITTEVELRRSLAQAVLMNKKQEQILDRVALAYRDAAGRDTLQLIDCTDDAVMYNNDINWRAETPSKPSGDAVVHINERLKGRVTTYCGDDIRTLYQQLRDGRGAEILITERNFNVVYEQWKAAVRFRHPVKDEQEVINLFLTDILNGTEYSRQVVEDVNVPTLFGRVKTGERRVDTGEPLFREGTNLSKYKLRSLNADTVRIEYDERLIYTVADAEAYHTFWRKYRRPPEYGEFLRILEHSARLYTDRYRRDTGGEYTPSCFVELQNAILAQHYDMDDFIVCDPCAGVGNLENQFGRDYKPFCYLSTLEQMDVDICHSKEFENAIRFDYLASPAEQPRWKYRGEYLDIREIARREGRKLMVVMNPPYTRKKGFKDDLALVFFDKVMQLQPDVVVYYCRTEFFLRPTVEHFAQTGYRLVSHVFSNAHTTFKLSEWAISQVIFDRQNGAPFDAEHPTIERYEADRKDGKLHRVRIYTYDNIRPQLIKAIEEEIKTKSTGLRLGQWTNQNYCLVLSDRRDSNRLITTHNLAWCLLLKGINFNTHGLYFETSNLTYRGTVDEIPAELFADAVMFSQFYIGMLFTNKEGHRNYIMPFTAQELGCGHNDLNVLYPEGAADLFDSAEPEPPFDFREFLARYRFSAEAMALRQAALGVFRFYHRSPAYAEGRDWNDSFYDITNAIMGKDAGSFRKLDSPDDRRITRVKTTKGTRGFGRQTVASQVPSEALPLFTRFFDARDTLARKINRELLDAGLLLWERENIY